MGHLEHEQEARGLPGIRFSILSVSDTRTTHTDQSGALIYELMAARGHKIVSWDIVPNRIQAIQGKVREFLTSPAQVMVCTGGTGIGRKDLTVEALEPLLDKKLNGFGEIFRLLSFQEIGISALGSRAFGGLIRGRLLFALPGSKGAVQLALEKILIPQLPHLIMIAGR